MMTSKNKLICILIVFLLFQCKGSDWTEDRKSDILNDCKLEAKGHIEDKDELESICLCSSNKFISSFSFEEYINIKESGSLSSQSIDNRLESLITEIMEDCKISF